jgi:hypothetical protein
MNDNNQCAIIPARMERVALNKGWVVTQWRVVDMMDNDLLQPWFDSRKEAERVAEAMGYSNV